ncbi:hypothetical protein DIS12_03770 [Leuconostoc citreum]|nr:hypothetical protein DIS12_03770 [Leuconostoc citreum]
MYCLYRQIVVKVEYKLSKNKYPEQTRKKILEVTFKLFNDRGYDNIVMQDIIDATGFSRGAIYHHFKNKNEIMQSVLNGIYQEDTNFFAELMAQNLDAITRVDRLIDYIVSSPIKREMAYAMWSHKNNMVLYSNVVNTLNSASPAVATIIQQGIEENVFSTKYPDQAAEVVMLLLNIWLDPTIDINISSQQLAKRFDFLCELLEKIGIPLFSEKSISTLKTYYLSFLTDRKVE